MPNHLDNKIMQYTKHCSNTPSHVPKMSLAVYRYRNKPLACGTILSTNFMSMYVQSLCELARQAPPKRIHSKSGVHRTAIRVLPIPSSCEITVVHGE